MWEGGTGIRSKERSNFNSLHLFCSFWHNFQKQMIALDNTVFQCSKTTSCWLIFHFDLFNEPSKKSYVKYGKYTDLQTYF